MRSLIWWAEEAFITAELVRDLVVGRVRAARQANKLNLGLATVMYTPVGDREYVEGMCARLDAIVDDDGRAISPKDLN